MKIASAYIEINNTCNLNCRSCYNRSGRPHPVKELPFVGLRRIAARLIQEFGCESISLSGGEPTLHSEFDEILTHLLSYPHLRVGVVTNGTTGRRLQGLIGAYPIHPQLKVQVSLDGSCEEVNAKTRGKGSFQTAVSTLSALRSVNAGKSPTMKMVISKENLQDVEAYYRFAVSMGCEPDFEFVSAMGNASDAGDFFEPTAKEKLSVIRILDRLNEEYGKEVQLPFCTSRCPLGQKNSALSVLIKCDGSVQPCQLLYDGSYTIGNLLQDETASLEAAFAAISELAEERSKASEKCARCVARRNCERGCMALAVMKNGDPLADDGECTFRKLQLLGYAVMKQGENK